MSSELSGYALDPVPACFPLLGFSLQKGNIPSHPQNHHTLIQCGSSYHLASCHHQKILLRDIMYLSYSFSRNFLFSSWSVGLPCCEAYNMYTEKTRRIFLPHTIAIFIILSSSLLTSITFLHHDPYSISALLWCVTPHDCKLDSRHCYCD